MSKDFGRSYLLKRYLQYGKIENDPNVRPRGDNKVAHIPTVEYSTDGDLGGSAVTLRW